MKSLHFGISLETNGLKKKNAFLRFLVRQNRGTLVFNRGTIFPAPKTLKFWSKSWHVGPESWHDLGLTNNIWFFNFHVFARKIEIVNPFSMPFSPTRSWHLALSYSTEKFKFQPSQNIFPKPHIINYLQKRLNIYFSDKISVFSQTTRLTQPQHEKRNSTRSNLPNNIKNSVNNLLYQNFILVSIWKTQHKLHQFN